MAFDHPWVRELDGGVLELSFPENPTDELLQSYVEAAQAFYASTDVPFAWVVDGTHVTRSTSAQRRVLADLLKREEATLAARCRGMALVVPNPIIRGTVQAVYWIAPPSYPHETFGELEPARAWARERMAG